MLVIILCILKEVVANHCPHHCECIWRNGKDAALCARSGFTELPTGLLASTQLLDLSGNPLLKLTDHEFNDSGLINIQRLYLSSCDIHLVQRQSFWGLINLVELDLSNNRLNRVPSHAFFYIPGLRELNLSENPIMSINNEDFEYLSDLVRLSLKSCKIMEIEPRGFFGLEHSLQYLELSNNNLKVINVSAMAPLRALKELALSDNPWNCTCLLRPIRDWMIKRNVPLTITPECAYPPRLRARQWNRIAINEFSCLPKLNTVTKNVRDVKGNDVTLTCEVSETPEPRIRWYRTGRLIVNMSVNSPSGSFYVINSKNYTSHLIIKSAELHDGGKYSCVSENQAGVAEATIIVTIEESDSLLENHKSFFFAMIFSVIIIVFLGIGLYLKDYNKEGGSDELNQEGAVAYHNDQVQNNDKSDVDTEGAAEVGRKRGDYQNVPSHDPEDIASSDKQHFAPAILKSEYEYKPRNYGDNKLNYDLHIPRKSSFNQSVHDASSFLADKLNAPMRMALDNYDGISKSGTRPRKHNFAYSHTSTTESEKNYPDLIEMSSYERSLVRNEYCTMRRRKEGDSCSLLIDNSRRSSSGGDSVNYEAYTKYRQSSGYRRSNSSSDLASACNLAPYNQSLPVTPTRHRRTPSLTPLLNINSLLKYSRPSYSTLDKFENHVIQMATLLNEYNTIGNQLSSSPKNTKDVLQRSRPVVSEEHSVSATRPSSSLALPDAATPLTLNVAELDYQPAPDRRSYFN